MSQSIPDPKRNLRSNDAFRGLARNRVMERTMRSVIADPLANYRKDIAVVGTMQTRGLAAGLIDPKLRSSLAALGKAQTGGIAARFAEQQKLGGVVASLGKVQTGGLAALLADAKLGASVAALGKAQTGGIAARFAEQQKLGGVVASLGKVHTRGLTAGLIDPKLRSSAAALGKVQTGGIASILTKHNIDNLGAAIGSMKKATDGYALSTHALAPPLNSGRGLMETARVSIAEESGMPDVARSRPAIRDFTADLVALERDAAEQRAQERREELEHRRQSLAIQQAMYEALLASEEARSADSKASAEREQAALARADEAEAREMTSTEIQSKQTKFMVKCTVAATIFGAIGSVAAVVTIFAT
jgi:hypothetical protein